jgi:GDP-L-fucose synthase
MNFNEKIYIAGHSGLVGSAIVKHLKKKGFNNLLVRSHRDLDLSNQKAVRSFFEIEKPTYVILAAAKVGGIYANSTYPADFIYQNLMIEANVIHSAYLSGVKRLLFLGSSCIYPKAAKQPMKEESLLSDKLESTNESYALAKIAGIKLCESFNRQYGTDFRSLMPTNLYGEGDNFDLKSSHVIPAVMRKIYLGRCVEKSDWDAIRIDLNKNPIENIDGNALEKEIIEKLNKYGVRFNTSINKSNNVTVEIWGTGKPRREFLYVDDMADASFFILNLDKKIYSSNTEPMLSHINIGTGKDITIKNMSESIKKIIGFEGSLTFLESKPDGPKRKLIDANKINQMGWKYKVDLEEGLEKLFRWYAG